jgi:hypothetical protein
MSISVPADTIYYISYIFKHKNFQLESAVLRIYLSTPSQILKHSKYFYATLYKVLCKFVNCHFKLSFMSCSFQMSAYVSRDTVLQNLQLTVLEYRMHFCQNLFYFMELAYLDDHLNEFTFPLEMSRKGNTNFDQIG